MMRMEIEMEVVDLFTKILEQITFTIEDLSIDGYQMGRSIFIIHFIGMHKDCSLKDIYDNTKFPASTSSRRVDELVKEEFVERRRSDEDRREIVLQLTPKGNKAFNLFRDHRIKVMKQFLQTFTKNEVQGFVKVLRKLVEMNEELFIL